jgi:hypothetical protein
LSSTFRETFLAGRGFAGGDISTHQNIVLHDDSFD